MQGYIQVLPSWSGEEIKWNVHVALPKRSVNLFKMDQQSRQKALRAYCPNIYILCEKAIGYFERAALMQPDDVKWQLMIASCYRRSGNYHKALETYKTIHRKFPENIECLKFLVKICSDMGLKEAMDYAQELKKAERAKDLRDRASSSRPGSRRSSSRASNLSRNGSAVRNK